MKTTTQFPPGYVNEYIGGELLGTAVGFLVVETVFMVLLYLSRYYAKGERANTSMEVFMTLAYMVCVGKITVAICKYSNNSIHLPFRSSRHLRHLTNHLNSVRQNRRHGPPRPHPSTTNPHDYAQTRNCQSNCLPDDDFPFQTRYTLPLSPHPRTSREVVPHRHPSNFRPRLWDTGCPSLDTVHQLPAVQQDVESAGGRNVCD